MTSFKQGIREQLAEGKIQEVLEQLKNCFKDSTPDIQNEVIIYSRRYKRLEEDKRQNTITRDKFEAEVGKLTRDILVFLEKIPDNYQFEVFLGKLPVIIISMTRGEATQLLSKGKYCDESDIKKLLELMKNLNVRDIINRYGIENREEWCPFSEHKITVRDLLKKFAKNTKTPSQDNLFQLSFYTAQFFSDDQQTQDQVLNNLKEKGGLFIIDGLSMFHLKVFKRFRKYCAIDEEKSFIQFIVLPVDISEQPLNNLSENKINRELKLFFRRYEDKLCFSLRRHEDKLRFLRSLDKHDLKISLEKFFAGLYVSSKLREECFKILGIEETGMRPYWAQILDEMGRY